MFNFVRKLFSKKVIQTTTRGIKPGQFHPRPANPGTRWIDSSTVTGKYVVQKGDAFIVRDAFHSQLFKSFSKDEAISAMNKNNVPTKAEILREQERENELRVTLEAERMLDKQRFRPLPINRRSTGTPQNSNYPNNDNNFLLNALILNEVFTPHHSPSHCDSSSASSYDNSSSCDSSSSSPSSDW